MGRLAASLCVVVLFSSACSAGGAGPDGGGPDGRGRCGDACSVGVDALLMDSGLPDDTGGPGQGEAASELTEAGCGDQAGAGDGTWFPDGAVPDSVDRKGEGLFPDAPDGTAEAGAPDGTVASDCPDAPADPGAAIEGMVYFDGDQSSCSWYDQGFFPKFDAPLPGMEVRLFGPSGEWMTSTCSEGTFQFDFLAPGNYLVDVQVSDADDCTSSNQPKRLPVAVAEGEVTIVTMGDSIAVVGQGPLFPEILAGHLAPLADIQNHNIAVSGTRSVDWVPGTSLFQNKLVPELPGADVLIITLGGNDVMAWVGGSLGNYSDLYAKMLELDEFLAGIHANVTAIITKAKEINPDVDVVFCLYFNYAQSSYWQKYMGSYKELALAATANAWEKARKNVATLPDIILADMYGALEGELLDPYLTDSVHLSPKGHQFYAEQVFLVLGGARVGANPLGLARAYGFHLPPE